MCIFIYHTIKLLLTVFTEYFNWDYFIYLFFSYSENELITESQL